MPLNHPSMPLPSFERVRARAHRELACVLDLLSSDLDPQDRWRTHRQTDALSEARRLIRATRVALDQTAVADRTTDERANDRCPAAHELDPRQCDGRPDSVVIVSANGTRTPACVTHGALLLASLVGARVYPLFGPGSAAIEVFERAQSLDAFDFGRGGNER